MDKQEKIDRILLTLGLETKISALRPLFKEYGSASSILDLEDEKILPYLSADNIHKLKKDETLRKRAEQEYQEAQHLGIDLLIPEEEDYPPLLLHCSDAPLLLYKQGNANLNTKRAISIVGTRNPTPYGKRLVERLVGELAIYQPLIVSGLAYGIDVHTHRNSIDAGLNTLAILGSGLCSIYPADHKNIALEMTKQGALLSEYSLYSKPRLHHFPIRNRIIAGMTPATLVVESKLKGGAMITAYLTLEYNRELMTLPHSIFSDGGAGCHHLIQRGMSHLVTSGEDIADILGWKNEHKTPTPADQSSLSFLSEQEEIVLQLIKQQDSAHIDHLRNQIKEDSQSLAFTLLNLEMNKLIKKLPGGFYQQM